MASIIKEVCDNQDNASRYLTFNLPIVVVEKRLSGRVEQQKNIEARTT